MRTAVVAKAPLDAMVITRKEFEEALGGKLRDFVKDEFEEK